MIDKIPTVKELTSNPQLAILDVLERTLHLACSALIAAYDDLDDILPIDEESIEQAYAHAAVNQIAALELTLVRYRQVVGCF